jgi:hypothetical protein
MVGLQLATKVQRWVKVKEKVENQARRADRQERVATTLLLRRANNTGEILFLLLFLS